MILLFPRPIRSGIALALLSVTLGMAPTVIAHPGFGGMPDNDELVTVNPAFAALGAVPEVPAVSNAVAGYRWGRERRFLLPLGWAALLGLPDRSPLYLLGDEPPPGFDAGRTLAQLQQPYAVVVSAPPSPQRIDLTVSASSVLLTDGGGEPIKLPRAREVRRARTPLDSTSGISLFQWAREPWAVALRAVSTADLLVLSANDALESLLDGGPLLPDTRYALSARSSAAVSLEPAVTAFRTVRGERGFVVLAARLAAPVTLARETLQAQVAVITDGSGLPGQTEIGYSGLYFYPGTGIGAGIRADVGFVVSRPTLTVGVGIRHLAGAWLGEGLGLGDQAGERSELVAGSRPVPVVTVTQEAEIGGGSSEGPGVELQTRIHAGFDEVAFLQAGVLVRVGPVEVRTGATVSDEWAAGVGAAVRIQGWLVELGALLRASWVPGSPLAGVYAGVGRWRE